ncbi:Sensitive to high expression protein [Paramyrothecium foliicola]|nr:Sensitive to high expression protein [Paramyrothecium foliicola]
MQPFARPIARVAFGYARLQHSQWLKLAPRSSIGLLDRATIQQPTACLQCRARAFGQAKRPFSTQPPPNPESSPNPTSNAETAADDSTVKPQKDSPSDSQQTTEHELPSTTESRRSALNKKFGQIMDDVQAKLVNASQTLNDITGYTGIESIKAQNAALEVELAEAHARVRASRQAYKTSNTKRANTQREVTTLLARKDTWSPHDLERFTTLYRADHELEGEVAAAQEALTEAEADEQRLNQKLNSGILRRYHEEQIWSDRIRRASTWGTWGLMGMNFLLFFMLQFVAEPWKRKRLVKGVVAEEKKVLEEVRAELTAVKVALETSRQEQALPESVAEALPEALPEAIIPTTELEGAPPVSPSEATVDEVAEVESWSEILQDPAKWKSAAIDLYSERVVHLRMRDASLLALEGAIAGAAVAGSIAIFVLRNSS